MRAAIAMGADINNEGASRHVDFIDAEQEQDVKRARLEHTAGVEPALARHETDIERAGEPGFACAEC